MDDLCIAVITCSLFSCLPGDIHLKIASLLPFRDVCALGKCSRYWRELCASNSIWKSLSIQRWPPLSTLLTHQIEEIEESPEKWWIPKVWPPKIEEIQDWKRFYYNRQSTLCGLAESQQYRNKGRSLSGISLPESVCKGLADHRFCFIDVEMFSFSPWVGKFINMIGVLYSITCLKVPRELVAEALRRRKIHDREVVIRKYSMKELCVVLVPAENWGSTLTLEDVALGKPGRTKASVVIEDID